LHYLGPGVSSRLHLHVGDLDRLRQAGIPSIAAPADLAEALGVSLSRLRWLAYHNELASRVHYVLFEVPKRGGGSRTLMAPHRDLARAQRWIFDAILSRLTPHDAAQGFVRGRGTLSNASAHCGRAIVINLDLKDFFPGIGFPRVRAVFQRAGFSPAVATVLALLCTECPRTLLVRDGTTLHAACGPLGLPQGACTSPALSNLVALRLDRRLTGLARTMSATYTRYADDMTFSGGPNLAGAPGAFLSRVGHIVRDEGFTLHPDKTRVLRQSTAQTVTGLVVNDRPKLRRSDIRRLRALLHRARHEGLAAQNRQNHPNFRAWLMGTIAYVGMSDPQLAQAFRAQLEALEDAPPS
jgi:retron-type reverse transcriptase